MALWKIWTPMLLELDEPSSTLSGGRVVHANTHGPIVYDRDFHEKHFVFGDEAGAAGSRHDEL